MSIKWCLEKKNGLELIEPNPNMSNSYLKMAEESIVELNDAKSAIWKATIAYYSLYYSLYAVMLRIGMKCEIHSCSLEFMKRFLNKFYGKKDIEMINKAFGARIDLQYYANRPVDSGLIEEVMNYCADFLIKSKDVLSRISNSEIKDIRKKLLKRLG